MPKEADLSPGFRWRQQSTAYNDLYSRETYYYPLQAILLTSTCYNIMITFSSQWNGHLLTFFLTQNSFSELFPFASSFGRSKKLAIQTTKKETFLSTFPTRSGPMATPKDPKPVPSSSKADSHLDSDSPYGPADL